MKGLKDTCLSNLKDKPWNFIGFLVGTQVCVSSIFLGFPDSSLVSIYSSWLRELLWEVSCLWALHNHPAGTGLRGIDSNLTVSMSNFFVGKIINSQSASLHPGVNPESDQHLISPYSIMAESFIEIMRIKEMIATQRSFEFSLLVLKETYREQKGEYGYWC